tara:strand:- start:697 stop:828 length:132 start_codon:yes stop_codon:yes gene_type:complete
MVRPEGVEPSTFWSEARRSIQLSYERSIMYFITHGYTNGKKNI